jgi:RNA polymerase sigma-70 factor (ECF subfamily)
MAAEDIVQNVFLKLFEKMDTIKDFESIRFWLLKTTRNEVYGYFRKVKNHKEEALEENEESLIGSNLSDDIEEKEIIEIVRSEIDLLPVELREIFVLREYSELSYEEISQIVGVSKEIVKSRLFSIRQKLIQNVSKKIGV